MSWAGKMKLCTNRDRNLSISFELLQLTFALGNGTFTHGSLLHMYHHHHIHSFPPCLQLAVICASLYPQTDPSLLANQLCFRKMSKRGVCSCLGSPGAMDSHLSGITQCKHGSSLLGNGCCILHLSATILHHLQSTGEEATGGVQRSLS